MLNLFDLVEKGYEVGIIFENEVCKLIPEYESKKYDKFEKLNEQNLVAAICEVCSKAMGALESAKRQKLPINGTLSGHPPLESWIKDGFQVMII